MCTHGTLLVCHVGWGWGWGGDAITFLEFAHILYATPRQRWYVNFRCFYVISNHGTLLVCSCVHMVRCWCVMCRLGWDLVSLSVVSGSLAWVECIHEIYIYLYVRKCLKKTEP